MPAGAISVTRPGIFGNPYKGPNAVALFRAMMRRRWARLEQLLRKEYPGANEATVAIAICSAQVHHKRITDSIDKIKGKNLACFCPLDKPCHADVLIEIANQPTGDTQWNGY